MPEVATEKPLSSFMVIVGSWFRAYTGCGQFCPCDSFWVSGGSSFFFEGHRAVRSFF